MPKSDVNKEYYTQNIENQVRYGPSLSYTMYQAMFALIIEFRGEEASKHYWEIPLLNQSEFILF